MEKNIDLSFFNNFGDELKAVKEYILEEHNGDFSNKSKLKSAIIGIRVMCGKNIDKLIKFDLNTPEISNYAKTISSLRKKGFFWSVFGMFPLICVLLFWISYFEDNNEIFIYIVSFILFAMLIIVTSIAFHYVLKLDKAYNNVTKLYILEFYKSK